MIVTITVIILIITVIILIIILMVVGSVGDAEDATMIVITTVIILIIIISSGGVARDAGDAAPLYPTTAASGRMSPRVLSVAPGWLSASQNLLPRHRGQLGKLCHLIGMGAVLATTLFQASTTTTN